MDQDQAKPMAYFAQRKILAEMCFAWWKTIESLVLQLHLENDHAMLRVCSKNSKPAIKIFISHKYRTMYF